MNITFTGRNVEITEELKKYAEKKFKKIEKFMGPILHAELIISTEKYQKTVEVNLKSKNSNLNAKEKSKDIYVALNSVFNQLNRRAKKTKEKMKERKKRVSKSQIPLVESSPSENIIRSRSYTPKPMTLNEAVEHMKASKQDIFVFMDLESGNIKVLHKKKNKTYELVEVE